MDNPKYNNENISPLLKGVNEMLSNTVTAIAVEISRVEQNQKKELKIMTAVLSDNPTWADKEERNEMIKLENTCKGTTRRTQSDIAQRYSTEENPLKQPDVSKISLNQFTSK